MLLMDIIKDIPGIKVIEGPTDVDISAITYDSRKVQPGSLFFAVKGLKVDGHDFIPQAIDAGATAIMSDQAVPSTGERVTRILCDDSRDVMALMSAGFFGEPAKTLKVIGITGTNGKTTTAYYVQHILEQAGLNTGRIGTTGVAYGDQEIQTMHTTPESTDLQGYLADMVSANLQAVVMEVSSHALDQRRVKGIEFSAALFTNLSQDHLDYHSDLEEYLAAKRTLFQGLPKGSIALVNADDSRSSDMLAGCEARIVTLGLEHPADYRVTNWVVQAEKVQLTVNTPLGEMLFQARTIGKFNYYNILSAIAISMELGIEPAAIQMAVQTLPVVPGRLEDASGKAPFRIIVDYAHTPDAVRRVLQVLRESYPSGRLITVFGCGGDRDRDKRPQMGHLATSLSDLTFITDDNPRTEPSDQIIQEIIQGVDTSANFKVINDRTEAIETALNTAKSGDILAILGKGHEDYQEIDGQRLPFSDIAVIQNYRVDHGY